MNQVIAVYNPCGGSKTAPLYQFDYGQELVFDGFDLPDTFEVQFANEFQGESTTQIATDNVVTIPDMYLTSGANIYAWIFLHTGEDDGETVYYIEIPVMERAEPTENQPTPVQQDAITQAIAALQTAQQAAEDAADDAQGFSLEASDFADAAGDHAANAQRYAEQAAESAAVFTSIDIKATDDGAGNVTLSLEVASNA